MKHYNFLAKSKRHCRKLYTKLHALLFNFKCTATYFHKHYILKIRICKVCVFQKLFPAAPSLPSEIRRSKDVSCLAA